MVAEATVQATMVSLGTGLIGAGLAGSMAWLGNVPPGLVALVVAGTLLLVFLGGLALLRRFLPRLGAPRAWPHFRASDYDDISALFTSWGQPAFQAAATLIDKARRELSRSSNALKRDLASSFQRAVDDGHRARSLLSNSLAGYDGPTPEEAMGELHHAYQGMSTWIGKALKHGAISSDDFWYRQWRSADRTFLHELLRLSGQPGRSSLHARIVATGLGEGVRHSLP